MQGIAMDMDPAAVNLSSLRAQPRPTSDFEGSVHYVSHIALFKLGSLHRAKTVTAYTKSLKVYHPFRRVSFGQIT